MSDEYDDNYTTCRETSASLRVMHLELDPDYVSRQLGIAPSWSRKKGEMPKTSKRAARIGIWALDTENIVKSRDLRRHIDWIIDQVSEKQLVFDELRRQDYKMDVFCLWIRSGGTGGPTLSSRNMRGLGALDLEMGFEFWDTEEEDS
jgi:Domain of unknown function (DUF4279)